MAIMARWRMPPLNWRGKSLMRCTASGTRTCLSRSIPRCEMSSLGILSWERIASSIWKPIRSTGFSELSGSWKIIAMSRPRMLRNSSLLSLSRSWPLNMISPCTTLPGRCTRPSNDMAVTLLPHPDFLNDPDGHLRPCMTSKLTPRTAFTSPSSVKKWVLRSRNLEDRLGHRFLHGGRRRPAGRRRGS